MNPPKTSRKKVVVVGGGFGGINAALVLHKANHIDLTIIDKANHHVFQPLLYQVATAGLSPADISAPIRGILHNTNNAEIILAEVKKIDPDTNTLTLDDGKQIAFDYLVLATGARHAYFGHDDWEKFAPGLKTLEDALDIRRRILLAFEDAEKEADLKKRQSLLTFAIVGAGPTGVETAGAIAELARYALARDFKHINPLLTKVLLIEAGPRIMSAFAESLSTRAQKKLQQMGVKVILNKAVTKLNADGLWMGDEFIPTKTVIWAAGVFASHLGAQLGVECDRAGRVKVSPDLSVPNHPNIFVVGDIALILKSDGSPVPGMAPGAIQEGIRAAKNILLHVAGKKTQAFRFLDKGSLATVGRRFAIGEVSGFKFYGMLARFIWIFIHVLYLISFRNRLLVLVQWAWSYFTFQRGARLITGSTKK